MHTKWLESFPKKATETSATEIVPGKYDHSDQRARITCSILPPSGCVFVSVENFEIFNRGDSVVLLAKAKAAKRAQGRHRLPVPPSKRNTSPLHALPPDKPETRHVPHPQTPRRLSLCPEPDGSSPACRGTEPDRTRRAELHGRGRDWIAVGLIA